MLTNERLDVGVRDRWLRKPLLVAVSAATLALAGCSGVDTAHLRRLGLPEAASDRAPYTHDLWIGFWIMAAVVGIGVWGMIGWCIVRYRRRSTEPPKQIRYNLPMEIFYTAAPFLAVAVLFYFTVVTQDKVMAKEPNPDHVIDVVGQKWSWTFNYREAGNSDVGDDVWEAGTIEKTPTLYLPVDESVRFNLSSPDVIHSFWVPSFYMKLDVVPGRDNSFDVTPTKEGMFAGKCAELCGTYHSAMVFNVKIVSESEYNDYLKKLAQKGQTGTALGAEDSTTIENGYEKEGQR